jgi:hypothetical protein
MRRPSPAARSPFVALLALLLAGGCYPAYALRAPASDCTSECQGGRLNNAERVACLKGCPGAHYSEQACGVQDPGGVVCIVDNHEEGKGELSGILLGFFLGVGLIVAVAVSEM